MHNFIFHSKPKFYAWLYMLSIPFFGITFYLIPETIGKKLTLIESMYFSISTITTLGYGDISPANDLGRSISAFESIFGITLIGLFLNSLSRVRDETSRAEEKEKEKNSYLESEKAKINGFYNLISPLIEKYKSSVIQITAPLNSRSQRYNPQFTFNDMMDLYGPSLLLTHNHNDPAVKYYFSSLELLSAELIDLIKNIDMRLFPKLEKPCLSFLSNFYSFDFSDAILGAVNQYIGQQKMTDFVRDTLKNHQGTVQYSPSNLMNSYVALYLQIKLQMDLLDNINTELKEITK